jgi:adenylate cyclase
MNWSARHGIETGVGIGVCRGPAVICNVGSAHYMSYTMIGNAVNAAARLMQMPQMGEALVSGEFYQAVRDLIPAGCVQSFGPVALRGKSEPVAVFPSGPSQAPPRSERRPMVAGTVGTPRACP